MPLSSLGGSNFYVNFKDDSTGYRVIYFIKHKSDVLDKLKQFVNLVETRHQRRVKTLHVDNGREYCNEATVKYLCSKGIMLETTAPYTPEQNGRAERDNRYIVECARTMLHAKGLPENLWAEAMNTACYILNRTPTVTNKGVAPYEAWTGKKSRLDHIKIFGSDAFVHVPKQLREKWDSKSEKMVLVGYQADSCNYRMYNPRTGKIIVSRDVVIHETSFDQRMESEHEALLPLSSSVDQEEETAYKDTHKSCDEKFDPKEENVREMTQPQVLEDRKQTLRDRKTLKIPNRYEANLAEFDEPTTYEEAISCENSAHWMKAINEELEAHETNGTWTFEDLPSGKKTIGSKWVFKVKYSPTQDTYRYKARLCAKGFTQEKGIDYQEIFAPVVRYDSIRVMLALAAQQDLCTFQFDVKTAFLNGDLNEEIYLEIPEGVIATSTNKVCRLHKSLYGLKQAPRSWNHKFDLFMKQFNLIPSKADPCVYIGNFNSGIIYLCIYVDDGLLLASSKEVLNVVLSELKANFKITGGDANYYVGMEIVRDIGNKRVFIHQSSYIKRVLHRFNMLDARSKETPADLGVSLHSAGDVNGNSNNIMYRQAIGSLIFLATVTRPDIAFIVNYLSRFMSNYNESHWNEVKKIFRYLKGTSGLGILYEKSTENTCLQGFSDADYACDLDTRRSTTGYLFKLAGGAVTWGSLRQRTVSLSTTEAEYIAACEAVKEAIWLKQLLKDSQNPCLNPIIVNVDNQSTIKLIRNPEYHKRSKHIDIRYHFVREKYASGDIDVQYVCSQDQLADILTKALSRDVFKNLRAKIGITNLNIETFKGREC